MPLMLTSLSQRVDEVRVSEIADYSTYYQPFVNNELFGFGKPVDDVPFIFSDGVLPLAWGSVVRIIAAGLELELDEPLTSTVEHAEAERDYETVSGPVPPGRAARCGSRSSGRWTGPRGWCSSTSRAPTPSSGRTGRSRRPATAATGSQVTGEPMMTLDFTHTGEHGDHNVSGMITTAMRLVNAVEAVVAAPPGLVTALDLPLVTGRGLVDPVTCLPRNCSRTSPVARRVAPSARTIARFQTPWRVRVACTEAGTSTPSGTSGAATGSVGPQRPAGRSRPTPTGARGRRGRPRAARPRP